MKTYIVTGLAALCLAAGPALADPYVPDPTAVPKPGIISKAPVGSEFTIETYGKFGIQYANVFKVQPDRSAKLVYQYATANQPNGG